MLHQRPTPARRLLAVAALMLSANTQGAPDLIVVNADV